MRKAKLRSVIGLVLAASLAAGTAGAVGPDRVLPRDKVLDTGTEIDANLIQMFVTNVGSFGHNLSTGDPGTLYPKGTTKTPLFAAGIWMGARVGGDIRSSVAEYTMTFFPGPLSASGEPADPDDVRYRVYKIPYRLNDDGTQDTTDYDEWPGDLGAPLDALENPLILGDQTLWTVYGDVPPEGDARVADAGSVNPLGIQVEQTAFAFDRNDPLGEVVFLKYLIRNRGNNTLTDAYVSIWSDPDLGGSSDDLVGCDTLLSLGYCYNATNNDNLYGFAPPAMGFDFFQGPIVASPGDTAFVSGRPVPDHRNLPMTSFNRYINGTDPGTPVNAYNYMRGLKASGEEQHERDDPAAPVTTFALAGDPVLGTGWLDSNPADRRMMLSSGPFTMAPGDSQEVVVALIMGQGRDRLTSITALRYNDRFAQIAFDRNFILPPPPERPQVTAVAGDNQVTLYWDERSEGPLPEGYAFEGYNVYMGESVAGPWKLIYTFDVANGVRLVYDEQFDIDTGVAVNRPVQFGSDSGPQRQITITQDFNRGGSLRNGKPYYFGVTAYAVNENGEPGLLAVENSIAPIEVVPEAGQAGVRNDVGNYGDVLAVEALGGFGDVVVEPVVVDPTQTVAASYEISVGYDAEGAFWNLLRDGVPVLEEQRNFTGDADYVVRDGILWRVSSGPGLRFTASGDPMIDEIRGEGGVDVPADGNGGPGNAVWHDVNSTGEWQLGAGGGNGGLGRMTRDGANMANFAQIGTSDIIIKWDWDLENNWGIWAFDDGSVGPMPWGAYLRDPDTGEEERLIVELTGVGGSSGAYDLDLSGEAVVDPVSGLPGTDWGYLYTIREGATYEDFLADVRPDSSLDGGDPAGIELLARIIFVAPDSASLPAPGTELQFSTTKPLSAESADRFAVVTVAPSFDAGRAKADMNQIRVVPNPYFAHSQYELNQFEHVVKFTRLPAQATIRIFSIAGDLVRTLEKTDGKSSFLEWDLLTERRLPVGSGVYIYHVTGKDASGRTLGEVTGRMAVFVEKERLNTF